MSRMENIPVSSPVAESIRDVEMKWGQKVVAVVFDTDGTVYDHCFTWESGQNYSQSGYRVVAMADDGYVTFVEAQRLYDWERACHIDCFGE